MRIVFKSERCWQVVKDAPDGMPVVLAECRSFWKALLLLDDLRECGGGW